MRMTYREDCCHVAEHSREGPRYRWMCLKHPRTNEGFGFVTHSFWDKEPPYLFCKDVNAGACPVFEPLEDT